MSGTCEQQGDSIGGDEPWSLCADADAPGSRRSPPRGPRRRVVLVFAAAAFVIGFLSLQVAVDEPAATTDAVPADVIGQLGTAVADPTAQPTTTSTTTTIAPLLLDVPQPTAKVVGRIPRVAFFGDSLAVEAWPHAESLFDERGVQATFDGAGGTATCDYLRPMRTAARATPDVVVLLFTGNVMTDCIHARSGGARGIVDGDEGGFDIFGFAAAYEADTLAAIDTFGPDTDVVLVGVPITLGGLAPAAQILDEIYRRIADERPNVHYLSTDRLLTPDHEFHDVLPCTLIEPCTPAELVPVRKWDGGHLCADPPQFCFGGLRMAVMIGDAVDQLVKA